MLDIMGSVFDHVEFVDVLDSKDETNLALLSRPDLGVTFTKLHCWRLTQYTKAVFMDADTMVLKNIDDLFEREELSAAPDPGWPDCFNSGVFVFKPHGSFDGGDQGLLNIFFSDWATKDIRLHLPFIYNVISQAFYSYPPAFIHFVIKFVLFILLALVEFIYDPRSSKTNPGESDFVGKLAQIEISQSSSSLTQASDESERQLAWERGQMDYMGSDSFEKIQNLLESKIKK
ncbi:unnamed protein product [Schistosoma mattheei]|uniref:glycogenin glucosyltransferase n=1 Tax=Schistosoma mattheei TaxID=31246 RepID=A0AA85B7C0_9TREM|nr:unnamed protein product [Schistosoma mattheei]